jgi:hypothetical protein
MLVEGFSLARLRDILASATTAEIEQARPRCMVTLLAC